MSLADKLTILRIILIPVFVSILCYFNESHLYLRYVLIVVFGIAVLTDFFDGLVARIKKENCSMDLKNPYNRVIRNGADTKKVVSAADRPLLFNFG